MAEPTLSFIYNHGSNDAAYGGAGAEHGDWKVINTVTDKIIFTGGGIDDTILTTPTCASGVRSPTIRPAVTSYVIPKTYVQTATASGMYVVPLVGHNANQYCMGVYVNGEVSSDIYCEAWDDNTFSTTNLEVLQGSANNGNMSCVNAIRTTVDPPPWAPGWNGGSAGAAYLRGTDHRIALNNASPVTGAVYYNVYVRLETDTPTFHNIPILGFRYLYT